MGIKKKITCLVIGGVITGGLLACSNGDKIDQAAKQEYVDMNLIEKESKNAEEKEKADSKDNETQEIILREYEITKDNFYEKVVQPLIKEKEERRVYSKSEVFPYSTFSEEGLRWGLKNSKGEIVLEPIYDDSIIMSENSNRFKIERRGLYFDYNAKDKEWGERGYNTLLYSDDEVEVGWNYEIGSKTLYIKNRSNGSEEKVEKINDFYFTDTIFRVDEESGSNKVYTYNGFCLGESEFVRAYGDRLISVKKDDYEEIYDSWGNFLGRIYGDNNDLLKEYIEDEIAVSVDGDLGNGLIKKEREFSQDVKLKEYFIEKEESGEKTEGIYHDVIKIDDNRYLGVTPDGIRILDKDLNILKEKTMDFYHKYYMRGDVIVGETEIDGEKPTYIFLDKNGDILWKEDMLTCFKEIDGIDSIAYKKVRMYNSLNGVISEVSFNEDEDFVSKYIEENVLPKWEKGSISLSEDIEEGVLRTHNFSEISFTDVWGFTNITEEKTAHGYGGARFHRNVVTRTLINGDGKVVELEKMKKAGWQKYADKLIKKELSDSIPEDIKIDKEGIKLYLGDDGLHLAGEFYHSGEHYVDILLTQENMEGILDIESEEYKEVFDGGIDSFKKQFKNDLPEERMKIDMSNVEDKLIDRMIKEKKTAEEILKIDAFPFSKVIGTELLWGIRTSKGDIIAEPKYTMVLRDYETGEFVVNKDGKYHYLNIRNGEMGKNGYDEIIYADINGEVGVNYKGKNSYVYKYDRLADQIVEIKNASVSIGANKILTIFLKDGYNIDCTETGEVLQQGGLKINYKEHRDIVKLSEDIYGIDYDEYTNLYNSRGDYLGWVDDIERYNIENAIESSIIGDDVYKEDVSVREVMVSKWKKLGQGVELIEFENEFAYDRELHLFRMTHEDGDVQTEQIYHNAIRIDENKLLGVTPTGVRILDNDFNILKEREEYYYDEYFKAGDIIVGINQRYSEYPRTIYLNKNGDVIWKENTIPLTNEEMRRFNVETQQYKRRRMYDSLNTVETDVSYEDRHKAIMEHIENEMLLEIVEDKISLLDKRKEEGMTFHNVDTIKVEDCGAYFVVMHIDGGHVYGGGNFGGGSHLRKYFTLDGVELNIEDLKGPEWWENAKQLINDYRENEGLEKREIALRDIALEIKKDGIYITKTSYYRGVADWSIDLKLNDETMKGIVNKDSEIYKYIFGNN